MNNYGHNDHWEGSYLNNPLTLPLEEFYGAIPPCQWDEMLEYELAYAQDILLPAPQPQPELVPSPPQFYPQLPPDFNNSMPPHHPHHHHSHPIDVPTTASPPQTDYRNSISSSSSSRDTPASYGSTELTQEPTRSNSVESSGSGGSNWSMEAQANVARKSSSSPRSRKNSTAKELSLHPIRRHRRRFSEDKKKETHLTRLSGACLRCWRNRKRV